MIELRPALNEALRNLGNWRNKYPSQVYPHKIVLNMMYRAYSTRFVYQAFANDEMPEFDDFQEAAKYVIEFYGETALREVMPYLEGWMANNPYEQVGSLSTARYEKLATQAETDKKYKEELDRKAGMVSSQEKQTVSVNKDKEINLPEKSNSQQVVYKIQILTSDKKLASNSKMLKGYHPVDVYKENGLYKYTYGESTNFNEIKTLHRKVVKDFTDAFIIKFRNGKKI